MILDLQKLDVSNPENLLTEMEENFFNSRVLSAKVEGYVSSSTYRAFRHKSKFPGGVALAFEKAIPLITNSFDKFVASYNGKQITRMDYDKWHKDNLKLFIEILNRNNVTTVSEKSSGKALYNTYAKPFNLLIWHYAFGKANFKVYDRNTNSDLAHCLHPAVDTELLKGIRIITLNISHLPIKIPVNAKMGWIDSEEMYYMILNHIRSVCDRYNNKHTGRKISPLAYESFWRMNNL